MGITSKLILPFKQELLLWNQCLTVGTETVIRASVANACLIWVLITRTSSEYIEIYNKKMHTQLATDKVVFMH